MAVIFCMISMGAFLTYFTRLAGNSGIAQRELPIPVYFLIHHTIIAEIEAQMNGATSKSPTWFGLSPYQPPSVATITFCESHHMEDRQ
jgi:hypothetical protein